MFSAKYLYFVSARFLSVRYIPGEIATGDRWRVAQIFL